MSITFQNAKDHLRTINRHKRLVTKYCFTIGLYRQGLGHDLSKYAPSEFLTGARFYAGTRSPNAVAREQLGVSTAWLHHKGRNKHHYEYWIDQDLEGRREMVGFPMPYEYVAEMFCDRLAASKVYLGEDYTDDYPLKYFEPLKTSPYMHPETKKELEALLTMLKNRGEAETLAYLKNELKRRRLASPKHQSQS
ncbi:MAG: catalase [Eubacteriaceae bacterium]|nr:catalase [Eubacteriaceae bacterium]